LTPFLQDPVFPNDEQFLLAEFQTETLCVFCSYLLQIFKH
jgi:hypothetical protein